MLTRWCGKAATTWTRSNERGARKPTDDAAGIRRGASARRSPSLRSPPPPRAPPCPTARPRAHPDAATTAAAAATAILA